MKNLRALPLRNLRHKPVRTTVLLVLILFLSVSVFGGSILVLSLQRGLDSLQARLGADVIVVPNSAKSKVNVNNILLQGTTGYFYMDRGVLGQIAGMDGVQTASAQLFLSSLRADCCSVSVQVIGFEQATDFTIQPWIAQRYQQSLGEREVVVGSKITTEIGSKLRIYNESCTVVAKLDTTGTGLDTAVYTSMDNIRLLMDAAENQGVNLKLTGTPDEVISAVYIKVKDGYSVESVTNDINLHVRKVQAIQTKSMLTGVADSLSGIASTAAGLTVALWVIAFLILIAAFCLLMNERKREFAVLRLMGASRRRLSRMIIAEAAMLSVAGGILGILLGAVVIFPFSSLIESQLGLPFLLPSAGTSLLIAAVTLLITMIAGPVASGYAAFRLSRVDAGTILREGN